MKFFSKAVILGIVLVIAGGAYWFFEIKKKKEKEEVELEESMLIEQSDKPIVKLSLAEKDEKPIVIQRFEKEIDETQGAGEGEETKDKYGWKLLSPVETGGDKFAIDSVIKSLKEGRSEEVIYDNLDKIEEYGLANPDFLVTFYYEGDDTEHGIAFGKKSLDGKKVFARVLGKEKIYSIPVELLTKLNISLLDLRDKRIAGFKPADVVGVSLVSARDAFLLEKKGDDWYFQPDGIKASKSRVDMFTGTLTWGSFASVEEEKAKATDFAKYGLNEPRMIVNFKLKDGSNFMFVVGNMIKEDDSVFFDATRTSDTMIFQVKSDLISGLLKTKFELKDRRIFDFAADDVSAITLKNHDKSFHLVRDGKNWKFEGMEDTLQRDYRIDNIVRGIAEAEYEQMDPLKKGSSGYDDTGIDNTVYHATLFFTDGRAPVTVDMTERNEETNKIWLTPDGGETVYLTSGYFVSNFPESKQDYLE